MGAGTLERNPGALWDGRKGRAQHDLTTRLTWEVTRMGSLVGITDHRFCMQPWALWSQRGRANGTQMILAGIILACSTATKGMWAECQRRRHRQGNSSVSPPGLSRPALETRTFLEAFCFQNHSQQLCSHLASCCLSMQTPTISQHPPSPRVTLRARSRSGGSGSEEAQPLVFCPSPAPSCHSMLS